MTHVDPQYLSSVNHSIRFASDGGATDVEGNDVGPPLDPLACGRVAPRVRRKESPWDIGIGIGRRPVATRRPGVLGAPGTR
ncbi:hypothetical protein [Embleya scabrispora]|uniref:hypothetical protein n=1 Tax=Embleya scabrispora TaxID=159449 RepID=UPI00131A2920|nr:hypothetical protein [Embleya scabrispora]MYS86896.1 hypothetical protein [Streptomyces sp. SID5474]